MEYKIDFVELADQMGGRVEEVVLPNGARMTETKWDVAPGRVLLDYFDRMADGLGPQDVIRFQGHTDPWAMLGIIDLMRNCTLSTHLKIFGRDVPICAYATGSKPAEGQPVLFQVQEEGKRVLLTLQAGAPCLPFEMTMDRMNLPPIPEGTDIYVRLGDAKILNLLGLALSLGQSCHTLYLEEEPGVFRCAISHAEAVCPGDMVRIR